MEIVRDSKNTVNYLLQLRRIERNEFGEMVMNKEDFLSILPRYIIETEITPNEAKAILKRLQTIDELKWAIEEDEKSNH